MIEIWIILLNCLRTLLIKEPSNQKLTEAQRLLNGNCSVSPLLEQQDKRILVLAINASKEDIIQPLRVSCKVTTDDSKALHRATRALWMGRQADFESQLRGWFKSDRSALEIEQSEYDIFLVKIELDKPDAGFEQNVTSLARFDAFRRIAENRHKVEVSPRLPSQAYENMGFYK